MASTGTATTKWTPIRAKIRSSEIEFASETEWLDADQDFYDQHDEITEEMGVFGVDELRMVVLHRCLDQGTRSGSTSSTFF